MSDERNSASGKKKPSVGGELIIPVTGILFTIYYFTTVIDSPWTAQVNAFLVGSILILVSVTLIAMRIGAVLRGEAMIAFGELVRPVSLLPKRLVLLGLTIGYILLIDWLGFTLTTFLFLSLAMTTLGGGKRKGLYVLLAALFAVGGWLLFVVAFDTRFPAGVFETFMKGLM